MSVNSLKKLLLLAPVLLLTGCSVVTSASGGAVDGGVYRSENKGETWVQKTLVMTLGGRTLDIRGLDTGVLAADPSDPKTLYLGSTQNGVFYTYSEGDSWQAIGRLGKASINGLAIDPHSKCVMYVTVANALYKSEDCGRFWGQVYFDNDPKVLVRAIAINQTNSAQVFITTSRGEIIKSQDGGKTWRTVGRLDNDVVRLFISPHDPKIIFAGTLSRGIYRSLDNGESWQSQASALRSFADNNRFRDLVFSLSEPGTVYLANHYGILKSANNGDTWTALNLITPKEQATINSLAVSPINAKEIYYVTDTTFYHSIDGGANWSSKKLPTTRSGWKLIIDEDNPAVIYLGVRKL